MSCHADAARARIAGRRARDRWSARIAEQRRAIGRARNDAGLCAVCGEPIDASKFLAWAPADALVSHVRCIP